MSNVSEFVCREIAKESVKAVFLVPGGFVDNLCHAIAESNELSAYVAASEAGAAMMADGYARVSGLFGACMAIAGPGASNMITGLSLSNADDIPVLAITGESPSLWRNRESIQDCGTQGLNTSNLLSLVAKAQYQILDPELSQEYLKRCMLQLSDPVPGVVHLSIPMEQQAKRFKARSLAPIFEKSKQRAFVDINALEKARFTLDNAIRTVILIGSGIRKSSAFEDLINFAETFSLPVATTMDAKGDFPENHPLSLGVFGWAGSPKANELIVNEEIDCLFVIGCKLGQVDSMGWSAKLAENRKLVQISNNASELGVNYLPECTVFGDAACALQHLNESAQRDKSLPLHTIQQRNNWLDQDVLTRPSYYEPSGDTCAGAIHPERVIRTAQALLPNDTRVFVDNGAHTFFASHYWESTRPNSFFSAIKYSGAMGWAVPASIGAHIASPASKTLVFVGDGCMLMHGIEIQTAVRYQLKNILFVVINNKAHGNPKLRAVEVSDTENEITDIADHDWALFARSLGVVGMTVSRDDELNPTFYEAANIEQPVLIDVKCGLYPTPTAIFDELFMSDFNKNVQGKDL